MAPWDTPRSGTDPIINSGLFSIAQRVPRLPNETDQAYATRLHALQQQINAGPVATYLRGVPEALRRFDEFTAPNGPMDRAFQAPNQPNESALGGWFRRDVLGNRDGGPIGRAMRNASPVNIVASLIGEIPQDVAAAVDTPAQARGRAQARAARDGTAPRWVPWGQPGSGSDGADAATTIEDQSPGGRRLPFAQVRDRIRATEGPDHLGGYNAIAFNTGRGQNRYNVPQQNLTGMTLGQVNDFQLHTMRPMTRGHPTAADPRGVGSTGVGAYQFESGTLAQMGQQVFGRNWRSMPFTPQNQERLAEALYNQEGLQPWGLGSSRQTRASQMSSAADSFGAPAPSQDTSGFTTAEQNSAEIQRLESTPYSFHATEAPRPDRPAPTPFGSPDFTEGNNAFAKSAPTNPFDDPQERTRFLRQNYFRGFAQGLMSMNWSSGPGVGELLARVGAGALAGRLHGDDEIRQRQDRFDVEMRQYQQALAGRNDSQAVQIANVANQNIAQMNQHNNNLYADRAQDWARNLPQVVDGQLVTRTPGANGQVTTTVTPVGPAARIRHLDRMSQIAIGRQSQNNQFNQMVWGAQREDARTALAYEMQNPQTTPQQRDQAMVLDLGDRIGAAVHSGQWTTMMPNETEATQLRQRAYTAVGVTPVQAQMGLSSDLQSRVDDYITSELIARTVNGGAAAMRQVYENPQASAAYINRRNENRRESTRIDSRGRVSRSTSESFGND